MEDIINLLFIMVFFAIVVYVGGQKRTTKRSKAGKPVDVPGKTEIKETVTRSAGAQTVSRPSASIRPATTPPLPDRPMPSRTAGCTRIRLATPSEARKAFIYSEIFNRKY